MTTRICPVGSCRAPVEGWEPFLAHVYEEHTEGTEESRLSQAQDIFERKPGSPGERVCVCVHLISKHDNPSKICTALPGVLGCGCLGFLEDR